MYPKCLFTTHKTPILCRLLHSVLIYIKDTLSLYDTVSSLPPNVFFIGNEGGYILKTITNDENNLQVDQLFCFFIVVFQLYFFYFNRVYPPTHVLDRKHNCQPCKGGLRPVRGVWILLSLFLPTPKVVAPTLTVGCL